jgi:hypothetical protein
MASDFNVPIEPVALRVLPEFIGQPNRSLSTKTELRWGKKGSFSVDLGKNTWHDHEDGAGGGVLDLLKSYKGLNKSAAIQWLQEQGFLEKRESQNSNGEPKPQGKFAGFMEHWPIATFQYTDKKGALAYEVLKFSKDAPRPYMQRRPHPAGGWVWGLRSGLYAQSKKGGDWFKAKEGRKYVAEQHFDDAAWFLYRRDEVRKAAKSGQPVFLAEGEKDVETLRAWGFVATTNQGGAKNWHPELNEDLRGADVIICPDNDDSGRARVLLRGSDLRGIAKSVRVLDLARHWDAGEKDDVTDWKEKASGTKEQFEELAKKAPLWKPEPPKSRFGGLQWADLDHSGPDLDYLIDGWLTERGRSVPGGPSGSGKSFLAIHAVMCVARGQDFFAYPSKKGGVIYQAGEGSRGVKKRFKAYRKHFQVDDDEDVPLVFLGSRIDLYSRDGDTRAFIDECKAWSLTMSEPLRLVVIDTLATATIGADENSGKDMSVVLANIAQIEEELGVHVMLVHHMNADGRKLRGHTSIHANVDQVVTVTMDDETKIRTAKLSKQKDDEDGIKLTFSLLAVPLGVNPKTQREITSCVVITVGEKERLKKEQERQGFYVNPTERRVMMNLFTAIDRHGKLITDDRDGPRAAIGKTVVDWKDYVAVAREKMLGVDDTAKATDQIRKEFERVRDGLLKHRLIGVVKPFMWWDGKPIRGFHRTFPKAHHPDDRVPEDHNPAVIDGAYGSNGEMLL